MNNRLIAYFSMEIALGPAMPTYAGGLDILAGDTVRSAADLKVPMVAVTLLHRKGYLVQRLDPSGWQREEPAVWAIEDFLQELPERVQVTIQGRSVQVRAWKYEVKDGADFSVPVFLLDTDLPENSDWDRTLTHYLYGGKAHPNDHAGKELIQRIVQLRDSLKPEIKLVYLENYDMEQARLLTTGVDVWLNTPQPPLEASGTSGMKAALNGVPSLSILDGWWMEGWIEGETGWAIGESCGLDHANPDRAACDAASLYDKLEGVLLPLFYRERDRYIDVMRHCISLNGSFFNTQRMVSQYVLKAYFE